MRPTWILTALFPVIVAVLLGAEAQQQTGKQFRIGVFGVASDRVDKWFDDALSALGYAQGRDVVIHRWTLAPATPHRASELAAELARSQPDLIVVWGTLATVAVKKATTSIPVVFLSVGVPVEIGLVASLAHPGGNMTGVTFEAATETYAKRLQLLKEVAPKLSRVAVLYTIGDANVAHAIKSIEDAAPALRVRVQLTGVQRLEDLESAFTAMKSQGAQGCVVVAGSFTFTNGPKIAELALSNRLPSSYGFKETVAVGGLVSLGPDYRDMARQGAAYVAKIIKGANPADLPIEQPNKMDLTINLKTAKALGLTVPQSLLLRADEVIQ